MQQQVGQSRSTARLVIMGPQGSGKGTQATRLAAHFNIPAISTGNLFRTNMAEETELGQLAHKYISVGDLVPDDVTTCMVRERLRAADAQRGFILDGYPRNAAQVEALDELLDEFEWQLDAVIELVVDREILLDRLAKRAQIEHRADDTPRAIAHRLDVYAEDTAPLTSAYDERGLLVRVDGRGNVEEIAAEVLDLLAPRLG